MTKIKWIKKRLREKFGNARWRNSIYREKCSFLVIGVIKGGTTALDVYMREHSGLQMPYSKEVNLFDSKHYPYTQLFATNIHNAFFPKPERGKVRGEVTPSYCIEPETIKHIKEYNDDIKLILLLRNPYERTYSEWNMANQMKYCVKSFPETIKDIHSKFKSGDTKSQHSGFIKNSLYANQVTNIYKYFSKDQLLVFKSEELLNTPDKVLTGISNYLDIEPFSYEKEKVIHKRSYEQGFPEETYEILSEYFESDLDELEKILDWDVSDWRAPSV